MAILVGDPIVRLRALGPDPCGVLPSPPTPTLGTFANSPGFATGTYYVVQTWFTPWGETLPSPESFIALGPGQGLTVANILPPGVIKMRAYLGLQAGGEYQYFDYSTANISPGANVIMSINNLSVLSASLVPSRSSAYLPDSDGGFVSSATGFQWLNQALRMLTVALGGIRDISGVAWPSGAAWQVLNQRWTEIENVWWDGWWQQFGNQAYTWLINPVQSVPGYATHWSNAGQDIMGLWPQPGQGPQTTSLSAGIGAADTTIPVTPAVMVGQNGFNTPGMIQIESEFILVSYTDPTNTNFLGCIRGVGGTQAAAHNIGVLVTQVIALFTGARLPPEFSPGSSYFGLALPSGWDAPLDRYMLARFREKEQDGRAAAQLDQEFQGAIEQLRSSRDAVPKNRQIGDSRVYEAFSGFRQYYPFGILIP